MQTMRGKCFLLLIGTVVWAGTFPEYPVKPISDYPAAVEKSGLIVAALAVEDKKEQFKYFGIDFRSKGYVPVLLVVKNTTSNDSYLLNKEALTFNLANGSASALGHPSRPSGAEKAIAIAGSIPTVYTFLATFAAAKYAELRQHLLREELQSTTLSSGASAHGFVFIPTHGWYSSRQQIKLTIPLTRSGTSEVVTIDATI
jgi:hypothetical protein